MLRNNLYFFFILLLVTASCKSKIELKAENLYGKWKYIKVENPNSHPPDSVSSTELQIQKPYILFSKNDSLQLWWGGGLLSHGTFKVDGDKIVVKEILADGKTRDFPFFVSKITDRELVFETSGEDGSRVTTVKDH